MSWLLKNELLLTARVRDAADGAAGEVQRLGLRQLRPTALLRTVMFCRTRLVPAKYTDARVCVVPFSVLPLVY